MVHRERESRQAVRSFAGDDVSLSFFYPEEDRHLIERDERVGHYEVAAG